MREKKQVIRVYLSNEHAEKAKDQIKASGLTPTAFYAKVLERHLDAVDRLSATTELQGLATFLSRRKDLSDVGKELAELLKVYSNHIAKKRI